MSEHDERGTSDLERRLDAAFGATRPRRGFEDELWAQLRARRPWWQRPGEAFGHIRWTGAAAGLAALVLVGLVATLVRIAGPHAVGVASTASSRVPAGSPQAAPGAAAPGRADTAAAALPFGRLPAPTAAGLTQVIRQAGQSAQPAASQGVSVQGASPSPPPPGLAVYKYDPTTGPADGSILEPNAVPQGLPVGIYPSRPPADAVAAAPSGTAVVLTQERLVYVAVVAGGHGYLEPAYLYTGRATSGAASVPVQLLVSALAPSALA